MKSTQHKDSIGRRRKGLSPEQKNRALDVLDGLLRKHVSIRAVAALAGLAPATLDRFTKGSMGSRVIAVKLAKAAGVNSALILEGETELPVNEKLSLELDRILGPRLETIPEFEESLAALDDLGPDVENRVRDFRHPWQSEMVCVPEYLEAVAGIVRAAKK